MATQQPNIIYILGDDHRAEQLACAGHPMVQTPNLDRLAAEGVRFDRAFCTSPLCTPSRVSHYLGQWERRHGINFNSESSLDPRAWVNSFPMRLKEAGYHVAWVGKNHVPAGRGGYDSGYFEEVFDYWYGNHGHSGFYPKEQARDGRIYRNAAADTQIEIFEEGAQNYLEPCKAFTDSCDQPLEHRPEDQPFCLCLTFNLPHAYGAGNMQLRPSDDAIYRTLYRDRFNDVPIPPTYVPFTGLETPRLPPHVYNGVYLPSYDYVRMERTLRERRIREYQTITGMDRMLGNLRETLERKGLSEDTVIVFSTDHGIHHGEHGLGGKSFLYEEDLNIPLIVYDPRLPAAARGQTREEMVVVPDLAPTMLELAGVSIPDGMQGSSLCPLLRGETPDWRQDFFAEQLMDIQNYPRSECVRSAEWKYIRYFRRTEDPSQKGPFRGTLDDYTTCLLSTLRDEQPVYEELFHLAEDPYEEHNLAGEPGCRDQLDRMRARLIELGWQARVDDCPPLTLPLPS